MVLLDSNIIINGSKPSHSALRKYIAETPHCVSVISWIEVLGYSEINPEEHSFLDDFFDIVATFDLTDSVVQRAISLRTRRRMTLGDSIIAATAIEFGLQLLTYNTKDFSWIVELHLISPNTI